MTRHRKELSLRGRKAEATFRHRKELSLRGRKAEATFRHRERSVWGHRELSVAIWIASALRASQ
jgi:hypothetical protein